MPSATDALPHNFRRIRMELARERGRPEGDSQVAYEVVAPLDAEGRIDPEAWKKHRDHCRVVRYRPHDEEEIGHLIRRPGGSWAFHYDVEGDVDDETGYRFGDERFEVGEYVSVQEEDGMHTFRIVSVEVP